MRLLLLSSLLILSSCDLSKPPENSGGVPSNLVLRSYDVPNNGAQRLRGTLKDLLWFGGENKDANRFVGRADVGPDGRLIVLAPESVHTGVKSIIDSLAKSPVKEPGAIRIDYWVVRSSPGDGELPANLGEISAALTEVKKNDGPMAFDLLEKLSVSSLPNESGVMEGRDTRVRQFANVVDGQVVTDIDLDRRGQRLATRVRIKPGVIAVLASAGLRTDEKDTTHAVYFVVRAADVAGQ
ncbi:MAG: hypothetical protein ACO1OB_14970 [Archangium sp.]